LKFEGKILILGCGVVARCTIPLILEYIDMPLKKITVIDMEDKRQAIAEAVKAGINFRMATITKDNYDGILREYLSRGDMLVDLSCNTDSIELLEWCHKKSVMYINASIEMWDTLFIDTSEPPVNRTLYARHIALKDMIARWPDNNGATAVLEHGANPGLVSHFAKMGLEDIAKKILDSKKDDARIKSLEIALEESNYPELARLTGLKVIHISERDTQLTNVPKEVDEFVNTWSVPGFYEEAVAPAEMGWGTHERILPPNACFHSYGPGNQICMAQMGMKTWVRSWVPGGEITGMVIRHGESFTLSDYLTLWKDGKPVYRPTVHYAYCPSDSAANSLHELEMRQLRLQEKQRVLTDEIIKGEDKLGALLMGHDFNAWWVGSILDIHESRMLVPHQNATTLQVACSIMAAILWMIRNPKEGVCMPEDIPYKEILPFVKRYLGEFISTEVNWTPLMNRVNPYEGYDGINPTKEDVWQFRTFLV